MQAPSTTMNAFVGMNLLKVLDPLPRQTAILHALVTRQRRVGAQIDSLSFGAVQADLK